MSTQKKQNKKPGWNVFDILPSRRRLPPECKVLNDYMEKKTVFMPFCNELRAVRREVKEKKIAIDSHLLRLNKNNHHKSYRKKHRHLLENFMGAHCTMAWMRLRQSFYFSFFSSYVHWFSPIADFSSFLRFADVFPFFSILIDFIR